MISLKPFRFVVVILVTLSCSKNHEQLKRNGALEALQMLSHQRSYPEKNLQHARYFQKLEKLTQQESIIRNEPTEPWEEIGPRNIAGRTLAVAINPQNNHTIFAGSASGGLWRSHNQGKGVSWHKIPLGFPVLAVSSIAFPSNDSTTIYIGTGEVYNMNAAGTGAAYRNTRGTYGMGILKSSDGGENWEKSLDWSYETERGIHMVKVAPSNSSIVYAGTTHGVYKSIDAGESWENVLDVPLVTDLLIHPQNADDIIAASGNFDSPGKGIYKTLDGGMNWDHWVPADFQGKIQLAQYDHIAEIVYASVGNGFSSNDGATWLFKSSNRGQSWTLENDTDYSEWQGWFSHDVAVHPFNSQKLTLVGITIYQSNNGGATIEPTTIGGVAFGTPPIGEPDGPPNFTHSDHHDVIYDPKDEETIYVANDGGIYGSFDGGENWQSLNGGLQCTQFYNGFSVFSDPFKTLAMGGLQDNSTVVYTGSPAWKREIGGDGSWSAIHPENSFVRYGSLQYLTMFKTLNGSHYDRLLVPGNFMLTSFIAPFVLSPANPDVIYAGRSDIIKSTNGGDDLFLLGIEGHNGDPAFSMDASHQNEDKFYFATAPWNHRPKIYISYDGGEIAHDITHDLPNQYINDIHVDPNDDGNVYIALGGFGESQVFKTTNAGQSWLDITGNLPKIPTSAIVVDPLDENLLYVGNDYGVFYSEDGGENWNSYNDGIIDAALVMDMKINAETRQIYAATHGSGVLLRDMVPRGPSHVTNLIQENIQISTIPGKGFEITGLQAGSDYSLNVYSTSGKLIHNLSLHTAVSSLNVPFVSTWSPGIYFIEISGEFGTTSKSVVKIIP